MLRLFLLLTLCLMSNVSFAHPQDEALILDIEQGQLNLDPTTIAREEAAAAERRKQRELNALNPLERFTRYVFAGVEHIIPLGLDHILFILGLFFSSVHFRALLWQITLFTLAHTISLLLAALELVNVPSTIVEPLIALSIAYVAFENIRGTSISAKRYAVVFAFGLLHGLGFASVLFDYGLPQNAYLSALFAFNLGVEIGQVLVIMLAAAVFYWFRKQSYYRKWIQIPQSALIGLVGGFWFIQRIIAA